MHSLLPMRNGIFHKVVPSLHCTSSLCRDARNSTFWLTRPAAWTPSQRMKGLKDEGLGRRGGGVAPVDSRRISPAQNVHCGGLGDVAGMSEQTLAWDQQKLSPVERRRISTRRMCTAADLKTPPAPATPACPCSAAVLGRTPAKRPEPSRTGVTPRPGGVPPLLLLRRRLRNGEHLYIWSEGGHTAAGSSSRVGTCVFQVPSCKGRHTPGTRTARQMHRLLKQRCNGSGCGGAGSASKRPQTGAGGDRLASRSTPQ